MTPPEINKLTRELLLTVVGLGERKTLAAVTGERLDAVSSVVNDHRPLRHKRKSVADAVARRGKNGVELLVGSPPPKVREVAANPKYSGRPASGRNPNTSSGGVRTRRRESL